MKTLCILLFALCTANSLKAQEENPVSWQFSAEQTGGKTYTVHLTATIQPGWHIYAQQQPEDAIAQPTVITTAGNPLISTTGQWKETGKKEKQVVKELDITQYYYAGKVDFSKAIELKAKTNLTGTITYMACNEQVCLPVKKIAFSIILL